MTPTIKVIMNGVTGRMGYRQHLVRSILAIREQGGVELSSGERVQLEPVLTGRNAGKLQALAERHGIPDLPDPIDYRAGWSAVPDNRVFGNCFKAQWEAFVCHVAEDAPHPYDFRSGVRGVRLAEAGLLSSAEGRRIKLSAPPE